jgi:hypothetical protein
LTPEELKEIVTKLRKEEECGNNTDEEKKRLT